MGTISVKQNILWRLTAQRVNSYSLEDKLFLSVRVQQEDTWA